MKTKLLFCSLLLFVCFVIWGNTSYAQAEGGVDWLGGSFKDYSLVFSNSEEPEQSVVVDFNDFTYLNLLAIRSSLPGFKPPETSQIKSHGILECKNGSEVYRFDTSILKTLESEILNVYETERNPHVSEGRHLILENYSPNFSSSYKNYSKLYELPFEVTQDMYEYNYLGAPFIWQQIAVNSGYVELKNGRYTTGKIRNLELSSEGEGFKIKTGSDVPSLSDSWFYNLKISPCFETYKVVKKTIYPTYHEHAASYEGLPTIHLINEFHQLNFYDAIHQVDDSLLLSHRCNQAPEEDFYNNGCFKKIGKLRFSELLSNDGDVSVSSNACVNYLNVTADLSSVPRHEEFDCSSIFITLTGFYAEERTTRKNYFKFPANSAEDGLGENEYFFKDSYNPETGIYSVSIPYEHKKGLDISNYVLEGSFDIYLYGEEAYVEGIGDLIHGDGYDGLFDGMGNMVYSWEELMDRGLDIEGTDSCSKTLQDILDEDGEVSYFTLTIPEEVTSIGYGCFKDTTFLRNVYFTGEDTSIGDYAFSGCKNLQYVKLPYALTHLGQHAFEKTSLEEVEIPETLMSVGAYAFSGCNYLATLIINDGVEDIGDYAFEGTGINNDVTIPSTVKSFGKGIFKGSDVSSINFLCPDFTITDEMFRSSYIKNLIFAEGTRITGIGQSAFESCTALIDLNYGLPFADKATIKEDAFYGCSNLTVFISTQVTIEGKNTFYNVKSLTYKGSSKSTPAGWGAKKYNSYINNH